MTEGATMTATAIPVSPAPRRRPLHPDIDEAMIERLVRHFYAGVRRDRQLGPVFEAVFSPDWEPHLQTMMAFWSSVMMMTGRFHGRPVQKHQALTAVRPEHFVRWLALFRHSAREVCPEPAAELFIERAERIAESLQRAMFNAPAPGQGRERR